MSVITSESITRNDSAYIILHIMMCFSPQTAMADEIKKLNMRISELESAEHMMTESSSNQAEIERQYHQQLQELLQRQALQGQRRIQEDGSKAKKREPSQATHQA